MKEQDQMLFDRACEITASAVRGAMGGENSKPAGYVAEVFGAIHTALIAAVSEMPQQHKTGF